MAKALRTIGKIGAVVAGVALIGTGIGAALGGTMVLVGVGSASSIAAVAGAVSAVASTAGQMAAGKPTVRGQVQGYLIGANNPLPYLMGEAYTEGVELYRVGYGGEVNDVQNPYAFIPRVLSCCGPIESMGDTLVNFTATTFTGSVGTVQEANGYYSEYMYIDQQLGARPESDALASPAGWGTPTNWSSSHKLSSMAAVAWSLIWSKKGKRWGSDIPPLGKVPQGVKVYDPRLDSTYPGGSGSHRITDESTWEYSANPALHALAYSYGRYVNGVKVFGIDFADTTTLSLADVVAWANVCDTNGWTVNGTIYEPADKWNNLKLICETGAGEPVLAGGLLSFDYQAVRTSLYTVTADDLAGPLRVSSGKGWKTRKNTLVPRYRSSAHQWGYVQADEVAVSAFVTADGEPKSEERQFDLVTDVDQATELATYDLWQRRELGPIVVPCKPHMRIYGPGDCLTLSSDLGAKPGGGAVKVIIRSRNVDPGTGVVEFTVEGETDAKHTAALGLTGGAPATTTLPSMEDLDDVASRNSGRVTLGISGGYAKGLAGNITQAHQGDGTVNVTIPDFQYEYGDGLLVDVTGCVINLADETFFLLYFDNADRDDVVLETTGSPAAGEATLVAITPGVGGAVAGDAYQSQANPYRHFMAYITTVDAADSGGSEGGTSPGGVWTGDPDEQIP